MKRFFVIVILIFSMCMMMVSLQVNAASIDLISSYVHTEGNIGFDFNPENEHYVWDTSGTTSVTYSVPEYPSIGGSATINVVGSTSSLSTHIVAWPGISTAEITFRPTGSSYLNISVDAGASGPQGGVVELADLTMGKNIFYCLSMTAFSEIYESFDGTVPDGYYASGYDSDGVGLMDGKDLYSSSKYFSDGVYFHYYNSGAASGNYIMSIDSSHIYRLAAYAIVPYNENAYAKVDMSLIPTATPEPATMLLLGLGLLGALAIRRKMK